jgi:predicted transcriptional regulator
MSRPISVRLPDRVLDGLDKAAEMNHRSRTGQMIEYIEKGLAREKWPVKSITVEEVEEP